MPAFRVRLLAPAALVAMLAATTACVPLRTHQGYVVDKELVDAIQPGVDNRDSVLRTLGNPTLAGQFGNSEWYYVSRDSRNLAFNNPRAREQLTLRIRFDQAGNVVGVDRTGTELIASVSPTDKKTPTLGRSRSFFQDLFGNIGTVGAPGTGGGGGPDQ
ncbi:outer membrane protein assembly factor BamE [Sphingomonas canadensis]|uniref:Outer membrane protein assembly factor BamE n=1 Tax=Sphingomonas canadensis TaxID=1219257 RepID=A0ABW3H6L7_9SPHN|nr:outer membrane protein assembly factor BamE [Sphingomonas canadensis]MCW3835156.1 outer membrane protein assembly factor BamE [Sphingomonas canadensis]